MKCKNLLLLVISCAMLLETNAQKAASFQVGSTHYLLLDNYMPQTHLQLYSTSHGGKMIKTVEIAEDGKASLQFETKKAPAFSLNRKTTTNINGDNKVYHFPKKEFVAKDIELEIKGGLVSISWNARVNAGNDIQFEIWKAEDQQSFKQVSIYRPNSYTDLSEYIFSEAYQATSNYILKIVKNNEIERYATGILASKELSSSVQVYPTLFTNRLFLDVQEAGRTSFELYNVNGHLLTKGMLNEQYNTIELADYPMGNYFLKVVHNGNQESFSLTKRK